MGCFLVDLICLFCVSLKVDLIWVINMNNKWIKFEMDEFLVNVCDFLSFSLRPRNDIPVAAGTSPSTTARGSEVFKNQCM